MAVTPLEKGNLPLHPSIPEAAAPFPKAGTTPFLNTSAPISWCWCCCWWWVVPTASGRGRGAHPGQELRRLGFRLETQAFSKVVGTWEGCVWLSLTSSLEGGTS